MSPAAERANQIEPEGGRADVDAALPDRPGGGLAGAFFDDARMLLSSADDPALRPLLARSVNGLHRTIGNRQVVRLLHDAGRWEAQRAEPRREHGAAGRPTASVQRYAVGVDADASCEEVFNWLQSSSPHKPAWAKTKVKFTWQRDMSATAEEEDDTYTVTVADTSVDVEKNVDMPEYAPTSKGMQEAWSTMYAELRAHEAEHEAIADDWQTTLSDRLAAASYTVTAESEDAAKKKGLALADADWTQWIKDHQAAQDAIDPFFATLTCPAEDDEESEEWLGDEAAPFEA